MLKLTMVEKLIYAILYVVLVAITVDGRLYVIADAAIVFFILITALLIASSAVGYFAEKKGRNRLSFFLLSLFFSPVMLGLIVAIIANPNSQTRPGN